MNFRRFAVSLVLAFVAVAFCGGAALAAPSVNAGYTSRVALDGGFEPDYTTAYFSRANFDIYGAEQSKTGTMTLKGGGFACDGDDSFLEYVPAGTDKIFNLFEDPSGGDGYYRLADVENGEIQLRGGMETRFSGMDFSFAIGSNPAVSGKTPPTRTLKEQLVTYVPHVKLITADGMATGLEWRFIDPKNPEAQLVYNEEVGVAPRTISRIRVRLIDGTDGYSKSGVWHSDNNEPPLSDARLIPFDNPIPLSEIRYVRLNYSDLSGETAETNSGSYYRWEFTWNSDNDAPVLRMHHATDSYIDQWATNHRYNGGEPYFNFLRTEIGNIYSQEDGKLFIGFHNPIRTWLEAIVEPWETVWEGELSGNEEFLVKNLYGENYYALSNEDGAEGYFGEGVETGLSESGFNFEIGPVARVGTTSPIRATKDQIANGAIPTIVFNRDEIAAGKISTGTVHFVDSLDSTTVVTRDADKRNVARITQIRLQTKDNRHYRLRPNASVSINAPLEFKFDFGEAYSISDLSRVRVYFNYGDSFGANSETTYEWRFNISGAGRPTTLAPVEIKGPTEAELRNAVLVLGREVVSVDQLSVSTRYHQFNTLKDVKGIGMENFNFARTMAAFFVSQDVTAGGAVVLGAGTNLPFSDTAFDEETRLDLPTVFTESEMKTHYSVFKSFPGGGAIDLLDKYGTSLFDFSADGMIINATLAIVDGAAPRGVEYPVGNLYGVSLDRGNNVLVIYDGVVDGVASDPISLTQKSDEVSFNSSGCATAGMILPFALFAAVAILKKRG